MASDRTKRMNAALEAMFTRLPRWVKKVGASTRKMRRMAGIRTTDHREVIAAMRMMKLVESLPKTGEPQSVGRQRRQAEEQAARNLARTKGELAD